MANELIGRIVATEKYPTTIDYFNFWTNPELILNPFDIVKVEHVNHSFSYGVIEDISHITDAASFLTNYISSDFGDVETEENTLRIGMNYVKAKVICNTANIYIPLQSNAKVMLATAEEINYALGLDNIRNPIVCGYLEMYEGTNKNEKVTLPVNLNSKFIIGPEGAHLNISGISGLASKTSYAMFLLKSIQDSYLNKSTSDDTDEDSVAFVLFNVKGKDLLAIDQINDFSDEKEPTNARKETLKKYQELEPIMQSRMIHTILESIYKDDLMLINDRHVELIQKLIQSRKSNSYIYLPNNIRVVKSYDQIKIAMAIDQVSGYEIELNDYVILPNGHHLKQVSRCDSNGNDVARLNSEELALPLYVRSRHHGDKIAGFHMKGHSKVKDIFINHKVPLKDRELWPVVVDSKGEVVWIPGIKKSKFNKSQKENCDIIIKYY